MMMRGELLGGRILRLLNNGREIEFPDEWQKKEESAVPRGHLSAGAGVEFKRCDFRRCNGLWQLRAAFFLSGSFGQTRKAVGSQHRMNVPQTQLHPLSLQDRLNVENRIRFFSERNDLVFHGFF